jgi:hypothetical protein
VNEEVEKLEERFQSLLNDRSKAELAHKQRLEKLTDQTSDSKRKLEEL